MGYVLRAAPEDFVVEEEPLYAAAGEGAHTFVQVEKRLRTTEEVARLLARAAGVRPSEVGYAGRKDRIAVARQWLSVPGLDPEAALRVEAPGVRVLAAQRHPHKLRTGQLRGNRFHLMVREIEPEALARAPERARALERVGFANRFGPQRFGADAANPERARALLEGREPGPRDRRAARFLVSSLQAAVFNEALARRPVGLDAVECGDVARVEASGGLFVVEDLAREQPRAAGFEISATGPLFGTRMPRAAGAPGERERAAALACGVDLDAFRPPRGVRARGARRPLRARPADLRLAPAGARALSLAFALPPGSYASVFVEALLG
jgi:tRNA pseudouridine13 synthase